MNRSEDFKFKISMKTFLLEIIFQPWVCLFVGWVTCVCLFVSLCNLCLARGLSVCPSEQVMFGMGFVCLSV